MRLSAMNGEGRTWGCAWVAVVEGDGKNRIMKGD